MDVQCTLENEKKLCDVLSDVSGFNPNDPSTIRKSLIAYLKKNHPDKMPVKHRKEAKMVIGELMDIYRACEKEAKQNGTRICKSVYTKKRNTSKTIKKNAKIKTSFLKQLLAKVEPTPSSNDVPTQGIDPAHIKLTKEEEEKKIKIAEKDATTQTKKAECIRNVLNRSNPKSYNTFDNKNFDVNTTAEELEIIAPKLQALLKNIQLLDILDKKKYGKTFKHFIYSDITSAGYGVKAIASGLKTLGMSCALEPKKRTYISNTGKKKKLLM